ncbi:uncharacterized protein LOC120824320 isoform X3 [Gasterosteus aculeatus]
MLENQKKLGAAKAASFNAISSKIPQSHHTTRYNEAMQIIWGTNHSRLETDNAYRFSRKSFNHGNASASFSRKTSGAQCTTALYEDVSDAFLKDYYSQKAAYAVEGKDRVLEFDFEGHGSSAGSVGCCSLLGSNNDLQFLNDLGPKFKTLSEICSPPTPIPNSSLTQKIQGPVQTNIVDIAKAVVESKIDCIVETQRADIKTLAHSNLTDISYCSNIDNSTLPHQSGIRNQETFQAQTVILQQWPVYYTSAPLLQTLQYVIQPQLQNSVLLDDVAHGAKFPGLHVVGGPQDPYSELINVISGIESPTSPVSSPVSLTLLPPCGPGLSPDSVPEVSLANPANPTLLLTGGPEVSQNAVPADGWKVVGANSDGSYILVNDQGSPGKAKGADPGTSQGALPRGANLVRQAARPQGVLDTAAQGRVYGILPGHTIAKKRRVVAVKRNLGQTWVGETELMDLGRVTVLGMGMEYVVDVKPDVRHVAVWSTGMNPVGIRQLRVNQLHEIPPFEQTLDASGVVGECTIASPRKVRTDQRYVICYMLWIVEGLENRSADVGLESQSKEESKGGSQELSDKSLEEDISPKENIKRNPVIATYSIQAKKNMEEITTLTGDSQEKVKAIQGKVLDPEVGVNNVVEKLSADPQKEFSKDTHQKPMLEQWSKIENGHTNTAIADSETRTSLQPVSFIINNQEDLRESNVILASVEMNNVQEESSVPTIQTSEHHMDTPKDRSAGYKEEVHDNQQHKISQSGVNKDEVGTDAGGIRDGEAQESFTTPKNPNEDIKRQCSSSSQMEDIFT